MTTTWTPGSPSATAWSAVAKSAQAWSAVSQSATAWASGFEDLKPGNLDVQTNLTGSLAYIRDDPEDPNDTWLTLQLANFTSVCRVSYVVPTGTLVEGVAQQIMFWVRKANQFPCSYTIYWYEKNGDTLEVVEKGAIASGTVTSTTGQLISGTFDSADTEFGADSIIQGEVQFANGEVGATKWKAAVAEYSTTATTWTEL